MINRTILKFLSVLLIIMIGGCNELDYTMDEKAFGNIYLKDGTAVGGAVLGVKVGDYPVDDWEPLTGLIRGPVGEYMFTFYNKQTGVTFAEQKFELSAESPETYIIFQPLKNSPLAFLDSDAQATEEAPPAGFMKIKIANYAPDLLPYENTDLIVIGINSNFEFLNVDTLYNVSQNLNNETYRLVNMGGSDMIAWTFQFKKSGEETLVKNFGGDVYMEESYVIYPDSMSPLPEKRIYTVYLSSLEQWGEFPTFIKSGEKFYSIITQILYAN